MNNPFHYAKHPFFIGCDTGEEESQTVMKIIKNRAMNKREFGSPFIGVDFGKGEDITVTTMVRYPNTIVAQKDFGGRLLTEKGFISFGKEIGAEFERLIADNQTLNQENQYLRDRVEEMEARQAKRSWISRLFS